MSPPWTVDYQGEWPDPLFCFIRSILTLHISDGHDWVNDWDDSTRDDRYVSEEGFESQACARCGAVRSRRWATRVDLGGGATAQFVGKDAPSAEALAAVKGLADIVRENDEHFRADLDFLQALREEDERKTLPIPHTHTFDCPECGWVINIYKGRSKVRCGHCQEVWTVTGGGLR